MNAAGIYRITVDRGEKQPKYYIGQAINLRKRFDRHRWELRHCKHRNTALASANKKYGEAAFAFDVLLVCAPRAEILEFYEQATLDFYIATYGVAGVYNVHRECVSGPIGVKRSEETRMRQSASLTGRTTSQRAIDATKARLTGTKLSPEVIAKREATRKKNAEERGYYFTPETLAKRSASLTGRTMSPESVAKMAASKRGVPLNLSPEQLERRREIGREGARNRTPEQWANLNAAAIAGRGRKKSPEEIARRQATRADNAMLRERVRGDPRPPLT